MRDSFSNIEIDIKVHRYCQTSPPFQELLLYVKDLGVSPTPLMTYVTTDNTQNPPLPPNLPPSRVLFSPNTVN